MKKNYPLVYVLTLNWNGRQITVDCIASVLKSHYPNFKVVVIDNGSTDGSVQALERKYGNHISILENGANLGYARGFNVGLKYGFSENNADYCLVMNNDTLIDPKAISELIEIAQIDDDIGFVTGKVYYYDKPDVLQTVGKREDAIRWNGRHIGNMEEDKGQYDEICERYFIDDIFTLVSKKLYKDIGGYNSLFFLQSEEYDLQARAKKSGYKIMYTPYAKLWHKDSMTIGKDSAQKAYYGVRNPMLVILLYKTPQFFKRYFWLHFQKDVFRSSLISLKQGKLSVAFAKWHGFFSGLGWGIKKRKFKLKHFF